ncbi:MAG: hypothetical protein ACMUHY_05700 [Thermoplasmatota archaeon]
MGKIGKKKRRLSPFIKLGLLLVLLTVMLFYTTNHIFIIGWNVISRSLFKVLFLLTIVSTLAALVLLVVGIIDSSKRVDRRMERVFREMKCFLRQFSIDRSDRKQVWGATVLFILTPVVLLVMIALMVSFTETCTPEFTIMMVVVTGVTGAFLLFHEPWKAFRQKIVYVQCRKCREYDLRIHTGAPEFYRCGECGYPELLDEREMMLERGYYSSRCRFCGRLNYTRKKKSGRFRCAFCRHIIEYEMK